jgi:hypothetical protein
MPQRMLRRPLIALLIGAFALTLSACGHKEVHVSFAETEGVYVSAGQLKYQVQISRQLNQYDEEDRQYLAGLTAAEKKLAPDQTWFAVFVRVENSKGKDLRATTKYDIVDTLGDVYKPLQFNTADNPIAYYPAVIPPHHVLPNSDQLAAQTSIGGELLLFKVPVASLDNRPLQLVIGPGPHQSGKPATVDLDV